MDAASTSPAAPPSSDALTEPVAKIPKATPTAGKNIPLQPDGFAPTPNISANR